MIEHCLLGVPGKAVFQRYRRRGVLSTHDPGLLSSPASDSRRLPGTGKCSDLHYNNRLWLSEPSWQRAPTPLLPPLPAAGAAAISTAFIVSWQKNSNLSEGPQCTPAMSIDKRSRMELCPDCIKI